MHLRKNMHCVLNLKHERKLEIADFYVSFLGLAAIESNYNLYMEFKL